MHYDGTQWRPTPVPNIGELRGVVAITPADAWAIGDGILHWNGAKWSKVSLPNVSYANLNAISASGSDDVWIVGSRGVKLAPHHVGDGTLAEHWDGSTWSVVPTPDPNHKFSDLLDVVTLSPTNAWIVGQTPHGITMHWNGTSWTLVPLPSKLAGHAQMWGIGTDGRGTVWALGDGRGTGYGKSLYLRWNGVAWQVVPGERAGETTTPSAVSGASPTDVWAVGSAAGDRYMIARYLGSRWQNTQASTAGVAPDQINLAGVTTLAPNDAWAVGQADDVNQTDDTTHPKLDVVILHWNGGQWSPVTVPGVASLTGS